MQGLRNAEFGSFDEAEAGEGAGLSLQPSVSFSELFDWIVQNLKEPRSVILLYTLITRCKAFRRSVLVRSDVDSLILPLLEQLHNGISTVVRQSYIVLVRLHDSY